MSAGTPAAPMTPAEAWRIMAEGNRRFVAGEPSHPHQDAARRQGVVAAQTPHTALLGCADSRLAAEIIFDCGLGDLFVVRNAGQVVDESVVGSLEYAVQVLGVSLIVVLGHDNCGAVTSTIESTNPDAPPQPVHIRRLMQHILPAVHRVQKRLGRAYAYELDPADVGPEHLRDTITELIETSAVLGEAIAAGRLAVVGANYRLAAGLAEPDVVVGLV